MLYVVYGVFVENDSYTTGGTYLIIRLYGVILLLRLISGWYMVP